MTAMSGVERTERALQRRSHVRHRVAARVERARAAEETVNQAVIALRLDRDARRAQLRGVGLAFVAERVEFGGEYNRRCDSAQVTGARRRDRRISGIVLPPIGVAVEEPLHL